MTDSVHGKSLLFELSQRHHTTCIIRSPFLHHHDWSLLLSLHSLQSSPSPPWLTRCPSLRHDNAFLCPSLWRWCSCLGHIVIDSDVCAAVLVSCSRSCLLTSAGFRSCGMPPGSIPLSSGLATLSICFLVHVSHLALLPEVALASVPGSGRFVSMSTRSLMIHPHAPRRCHLRQASDSAV